MAQKYSNPQRIAFAGLLIGTLMCFSSIMTPYWRKGEISIDDVTGILSWLVPEGKTIFNIFGDVKLSKMNSGLLYFCVETVISGKDCHTYDTEHVEGREKTMYVLLSIQFLVSIACVLGALCRMCCCHGGRTVCHGILAFVAGMAGVGVVSIYAMDCEESFAIKLIMPSFDWGFYMYAAGSAIITITSFMLCFASPDNQLTSIILSNLPTMPQVSVYSRMDNTQSVGQVMVPVADGYGYDQPNDGLGGQPAHLAPGHY